MAFIITATTPEQATVRWNNYWEDSSLPWCKRYKTRKTAEAARKKLSNNRSFNKISHPIVTEE